MAGFINSILGKFNFKLERKKNDTVNAESYPAYVEEAKKLNIDINDYLDNNLGWVKPLPILEEVVFPYLNKISNPKILELGPGTGRWTRHILNFAKQKDCNEYLLVDHSEWMINFLKSYFKDENIIKFFRNDGKSLPDRKNEFDLIFSQGLFIMLKPALLYLYSLEFSKILKPGGFLIFDYFNCENNEGWEYFIKESEKGNLWYTYYPDDFVNKIFESAGFKFEKRFTYGKAKYVVYKKL